MAITRQDIIQHAKQHPYVAPTGVGGLWRYKHAEGVPRFLVLRVEDGEVEWLTDGHRSHWIVLQRDMLDEPRVWTPCTPDGDPVRLVSLVPAPNDPVDVQRRRHTLEEDGTCWSRCEACAANRRAGLNPDGTSRDDVPFLESPMARWADEGDE